VGCMPAKAAESHCCLHLSCGVPEDCSPPSDLKRCSVAAGTPYRFRLNWGAGGKRVEMAPEFSVFVGDLAPDVSDAELQQLFAERFPSTLGAKVCPSGGQWPTANRIRGWLVKGYSLLGLVQVRNKIKYLGSSVVLQAAPAHRSWHR
jgi:hypothetical protein